MPKPAAASPLGYMIFASRWLQVPLYVGLIIAQMFYVWQFILELVHLFEGIFLGEHHMTEAELMLAVLGMVDIVMIANLLIMVIIGGYETFVSRIRIDGHPDQPEWLSHVNANVLKTKLAMSIIGISSIHLLRTFIQADDLLHDPRGQGETIILWQTLIHIAFIVSAMALAWIDRISAKPHERAAAAAWEADRARQATAPDGPDTGTDAASAPATRS